MNGKVLVTGCSGLVGTHTVNKLVEKGYEVIGVDIKTSNFLPTKNFEFHQMENFSHYRLEIKYYF